MYSKYILKSYISFKAGNENKYYVDYCVSRNGNNVTWYRFDKEYKQIQQNELFDSEPILLFYETTEKVQKNKKVQKLVEVKTTHEKPINKSFISFINSVNYLSLFLIKVS